MTTVTERLVNRLAGTGARRKASRRSFLTAATLTGTALAVDPWGFITKPQSAYAATCGPDASCGDGYTVFCCTINHGSNTCPPNTFAGGWWKADRSSYCGGAARYYIDCNANPGHHFNCHCNKTTCDRRRVACNVFRYGQCNTHIHGTTAVVCRQISCRPPWEIYPGKCGRSSATDNNTAQHTAPCLTHNNTFPRYVTWPKASPTLYGGHVLRAGHRLTSPDRHTTVVMHAEGDLAVHNARGKIWATPTLGEARDGWAVMHPNGDLVVEDAHGHLVWSTRSASTRAGTAVARIRNDGHFVVLKGGVEVWSTHTHTP